MNNCNVLIFVVNWFIFSNYNKSLCVSFIYKGIASTVKTTLQESCVQLLSPRRRVDILRDAMDAKQKKRPYVITFCGVNGVGKSTNLAKVGY